jgi:hypothetical protein
MLSTGVEFRPWHTFCGLAAFCLCALYPFYLFLRALSPRQRHTSSALIAAIGLALWLGIKKITK